MIKTIRALGVSIALMAVAASVPTIAHADSLGGTIVPATESNPATFGFCGERRASFTLGSVNYSTDFRRNTKGYTHASGGSCWASLERLDMTRQQAASTVDALQSGSLRVIPNGYTCNFNLSHFNNGFPLCYLLSTTAWQGNGGVYYNPGPTIIPDSAYR